MGDGAGCSKSGWLPCQIVGCGSVAQFIAKSKRNGSTSHSRTFADSINPIKTEQAEKIRQAKIQKERERRRREVERQVSHKDSKNEQEPEDNKLDVMV